jgi:tetratricopeptide (TPR) repeat protein
MLTGSLSVGIRAERVMIEAAEKAVRERRDPSRMLRVLALLASPVYDPNNPETAPVHLDLQAEWHGLSEGVRQSGAPILLARLSPPTLPALRAALSPRAEEQGVFPQVLHFSGHAWEEGLVLEDELGQLHSAGTAQVIDALKDLPGKIDLVVLNGCESAAAARSVAQALLDGGLARTVLGHEKAVRDREAVAFAARLYAELCNGFPLRRALENAGKEITTHQVILLGDGEMRFESLSGGELIIDERRPRGSLLPPAKLFLGRGAELVELARALAQPPAAIIISGPPGLGKSSLLLEAAMRSSWRFPGGIAYAAGPRPEEARPAKAADLLAALADALGLERAEDLLPHTALQPTLLLLDNLDSLADEETVRLREALRRLGSESAAILALRSSSEILGDLPSAFPMPLHYGLDLREAEEYVRFQADPRKIRLPPGKAQAIARAVDGHPRLLEQLVAQASRKDLDGLLEDIGKRKGDYAKKIEEVYSWCAARLDTEGEAAWRALPLFPGGNAPQTVLQAAAGEGGPERLREAALADFDSASQLWRWHATVAEYASSHWPLPEEERRAQSLALLPAWEKWLKRLPDDEMEAHSRLEGSRANLEAAVEECIGAMHQQAWPFLDGLDGKLPRPDRTLILRELAEKVENAKLLILPAKNKAERATCLNNLGYALFALGKREEALQAVREATDIYRKLSEANPQFFLPKFAMSLNNLGNALSDIGQHGDALAVAQEAANICRKLAESHPQTFNPLFAMILNNLGRILSFFGRKEDALAAAQESRDIYRSLVRSNPQLFLPNLVEILDNLGEIRSAVNRNEDALTAAQEAANICSSLVESNPKAFLPDLAKCLGNLGNRFSALDRREDALEAARNALDAYCNLLKFSPRFFLPEVATGFNNLGLRLSALGKQEEALQATKKAVGIRRKLADANPHVFLPELAKSLGVYGKVLISLKQYREAVQAFHEGLAHLAPFCKKHPQAFAGLAGALKQLYLEACRKAGLEPDGDLLSRFD